MRNAIFFFILLLSFSGCTTKSSSEGIDKIPVKVVVVNMFERDKDEGDVPGEFQYWVERLPLDETISFPQGYRDLRYNAELGVLGIVTGVGNTKAGISITALGLDPRFDLSKAYWLVAGISGIDPEDGPTGSAAWAEWLVDGDLAHEIDPREIPKDWPTGYIPLRMSKPYEKPLPLSGKSDMVIRLDSRLVDWAFQLTKDLQLPDNQTIRQMRARYTDHPASAMEPVVMKGDQLAASTYWHGALLNDWANDWVSYWTEGQGNFVTSAMEEMGTYHALDRLHQIGKADKNRLLVLRTASNFTMQWPEASAYESLAGEKISGKGYSAYIPALEAAYQVGSTVVKEIVGNWEEYENQMPQ